MESVCLRVCMLIFMVQYSIGFSNLLNKNNITNHVCLEEESQVLLQLKQQLSPALPEIYYKTKYWKGSRDCCVWDGVTCDYFTRHVIALDLSGTGDYSSNYLTGKLNPNSSLFHLGHLRSLNLAYNNFGGSALPPQFGRLNALTHLNLSGASFEGEMPMEFYHLSNLLSLDLSRLYPYIFGEDLIRCDVKMLFGNMTRLRVLLLANQNLSSSELPMNMSSFLMHLDLRDTGLQGKLPPTIFEKPNLQILNLWGNDGLEVSLPKSLNRSNVNSIQTLDLGETSISGRLPDSIGLMTSLNYLRLSDTRLFGPLPESIGNITSITYIDLSRNNFNGRLPSTIFNLRHLTSLDLSQNHLEGQISDVFSAFQNIIHLHLSLNNLEGQIPASLTNMSRLQDLRISSNALTGPFPSTAGHGLQHLFCMSLYNNSIQGTIPPWLFTLPSLQTLYLASNRFTGQIGKLNPSETLSDLDLSFNGLNIQLESFYNLTYIDVSHNTVTVTEHGVNVTFPNLVSFYMSSCDIKKFPNLLRGTMPSLEGLDLSNNSIHGPIPSWFTSNPSQTLQFLDLSANFLTYAGYLPWRGLTYLDLHSNLLHGAFPSSICNMSGLQILNLSHNKMSGNILECLLKSTTQLWVLDLSRNKFHGNIPEYIANNSQLQVLDLRRNEFHRKIPTTIGAMYELVFLGLNGNHLEGTLPPSLANCTDLQVIDLGNNMLQDTFPWWLHSLPQLKILILKANSFHGSITSPPFTHNSFLNLQILDLSHNNFTGLLPQNLFATLEAIKYQTQADGHELYMRDQTYEYSVTLSVKGADVEFTKVLKIFNTIDLSSNHFTGTIPESLSNLTALRLLNLSHNSIHGSIPPALGRMTNLEQLDLSTNQLTGGIPETLTDLTFLGDLDLSHNHLAGPIPQGKQFPTFSNDSYAGNSGLCGAPLTKSCGEPPSAGDFDEEEEEDGFMMGFTWKVVVIGYGCGIVLGFILGNVLISMEKPRCLARFVYVEAHIILRRRMRNKRRRAVTATE